MEGAQRVCLEDLELIAVMLGEDGIKSYSFLRIL